MTGPVDELTDALRRSLPGRRIRIDDLTRLTGGVSRETWSGRFGLDDFEPVDVVIQRTRRPPRTVTDEAQLLRSAAAAGVPVPAVLAAATDHADRLVLVASFVAGDVAPGRVIERAARQRMGATISFQCGAALARLQQLPIKLVAKEDEDDPLDHWQNVLDRLGEVHPTFDLAFRWLRRRRPPAYGPVVVHGDFRTGNLVVDDAGLAGILDWEHAHAGDALEDVGWLTAEPWCYDRPEPVGGLGPWDALLAGYLDAGGEGFDRAHIEWWRAFASLRWGIMCVAQAHLHQTGKVRSLDLAALGRRVCESEWDLLTTFGVGR